MKLFSKIAVVAAAFMLLSVFAGCKTEEEKEAEIVAVYQGSFYAYHQVTMKQMVVTVTFNFYDDDSFIIHESDGTYNLDVAAGTYEGNPEKDGKVKLTVEEIADEETLELETINKKVNATIIITDGKFTTSDIPLFPSDTVFKRQ